MSSMREQTVISPLLPSELESLSDVRQYLEDQALAGSVLGERSVLYDEVVTVTADKSSAYTLAEGDHHLFVDTSGGAITITLPLAADFPGREFVVKKTNTSNAVTLARSGSDLIDSATTHVYGSGNLDSRTVVSDGVSNWWIV